MPSHPPQLEVLFIDMDAYFASCEQMDQPELVGRPIAVTPVLTGSGCCIASSYEARAAGVRTGCRVSEARKVCPGIEVVAARPSRYIQLHHQIMAAIDTAIPVSSVDSIDECWSQLIGVEREQANAERIGRQVKEAIWDRVGPINCSVGIGPNRLIAKVAGALDKPNGLKSIVRNDLPGPLSALKLTDLPGINKGIRRRLRVHDIHTIDDLYATSMPGLKKAWGSVLGEYWWHWIRGEHARLPSTRRRTVSHQHVLAPQYRTGGHPLGVAHRLMAKAAQRLRSLEYVATRVSVSLAMTEGGRWSDWSPIDATSDTMLLCEAMRALWKSVPKGGGAGGAGGVLQVGVGLEGLERADAQPSLFAQVDPRPELMRAMDKINMSYGSDTVYLGSMHHERKTAPRRIPFGPPPSLDLPDVDEGVAMEPAKAKKSVRGKKRVG